MSGPESSAAPARQKRQSARVLLIAGVLILAGTAYWAHERYDPTVAAKKCQANIMVLTEAEEEYCRQHGVYAKSTSELAAAHGASRSSAPKCPLDGTPYRITTDPKTGEVQISCVYGEEHARYLGTKDDYIGRLIGGDRR